MAEEPETDEDLDAEGAEEGDEAPKKGGLNKLILFVGLPAVIVVLAGVAGALLFLGGEDETAVAEGENGEAVAEEEGPTAAERFAALHNFERTIEVNIEGDEGRILTMRMEYVLVYSDHELDAILESEVIVDRLRTSYVEFLRTLRADDIYGSMGTFRIRAEMRRRANLELAPHAIEDVLIPELIIA